MTGRLTEELRRATRAQSELRPVDPGPGSEDDVGPRSLHGPFGWVSLLLLGALFVGGWYIVRQVQANAKLQDCVMSGRKNCAPIDTGSMRSTPP